MSTTIVYRCPGPHLITGGITFDTLGIQIVDLDKALSEGWFETVPAAIEAFSNPRTEPVAPVPAAPDDEAPPTRAELEEMASELKIEFNADTSDDALAEAIEAALRTSA